jgi:hypothetical protein
MAAPLALYLALEPSTAMGGAGRWRGMTVAAAVLAVAGGFTLAAYGAAFAAGDQAWTKRDLHEFLFRMATFPYDDWGSWSNYSKAGLRAFAEAHLWMFSPKFAFIHHRVTQLFLAGLGTLAAINVAQALRGATGWRLRVFLLAWLAVWYGFNLWWLPGEGEFYIIALFPLLLLCAITLRDILGPVDRLWHGWLPAAGLCGLAAWLAAINHGAILPEHESAGQAYWEAEQVNAVAPPGCAVAHDWYVNGNLGYHFQRQTYEIALSRMYFLLDAPFPTWLKTTEKVCTVTFLESIDPGFHYVATAPQMNPVGYRAWLMWLFDYQPGEGEAPGTMRRFEIATGAEGAAYLVLHTERRYVQDFRGMLGVLDGAMNAHLGEERNMFRQWFEERYWEMLLRL